MKKKKIWNKLLSNKDILGVCHSIPQRVRSRLIELFENQFIEYLAGPFWVTPKDVRDKYGMLREEMRTYASDSEYDNRIRGIFKRVDTVKVMHHIMRTVVPAGVEGGEEAAKDQVAYRKLKKEGKAR